MNPETSMNIPNVTATRITISWGLVEKTPADLAGIRGRGGSKGLTLIQNASKNRRHRKF